MQSCLICGFQWAPSFSCICSWPSCRFLQKLSEIDSVFSLEDHSLLSHTRLWWLKEVDICLRGFPYFLYDAAVNVSNWSLIPLSFLENPACISGSIKKISIYQAGQWEKKRSFAFINQWKLLIRTFTNMKNQYFIF